MEKKDKKIIKGFKGFNKDLTCNGFKYEEGKEYIHNGEVKICNSGFHFCENPLDCLYYYRLNDSIFHEVEGSGKIDKEKNSDTKISCSNIKIGARLSIETMVKASVDFIWSKASEKKIFKKTSATSGNRAHSATSGNDAHSATSGEYAHSATSGYGAHSATSGEYAHSATSGNRANSATSGEYAHSATSGEYAHSATSGYDAHSATSGEYAHSATSGNRAHSATSGEYAHSATSGNDAHSATSGEYAHSATSGNRANSATSGYGAHSATKTSDAIACAIGRKSKAKASLGSFIVLAEWNEDNDLTKVHPIAVKSAKVDGKKIKSDTWYKLVSGKFIETDDSNE